MWYHKKGYTSWESTFKCILWGYCYITKINNRKSNKSHIDESVSVLDTLPTRCCGCCWYFIQWNATNRYELGYSSIDGRNKQLLAKMKTNDCSSQLLYEFFSLNKGKLKIKEMQEELNVLGYGRRWRTYSARENEVINKICVFIGEQRWPRNNFSCRWNEIKRWVFHSITSAIL